MEDERRFEIESVERGWGRKYGWQEVQRGYNGHGCFG